MNDKYEVIVLNASDDRKTLGSSGRPSRFTVEELTKSVQDFHKKVSVIFSQLEDTNEEYSLDEITINAEITASGSIGFLGSGATSGFKGGFTLKFVKK